MNRFGFGFLRLSHTGSKGSVWPLLAILVDRPLAGE